MIEIPVTKDFDPYRPIGKLIIDEKELPDRPDFHFAIGGYHTGKFKLVCVSLLDNSKFKR